MRDVRKAAAAAAAASSLWKDLPDSFEQALPKEQGDPRHFGLISVALILLGNGLTDEAHSLLTPLSYPQEIPFGYGPVVYSQVSEPARTCASYVHSLVHRKEAKNIGEFDMMGFDNADYWSSIVFRSPGAESLPHEELHQQIAALAASYSNSPSVQTWYQANFDPSNKAFFEARVMHNLCRKVMDKNDDDEKLREFAERASETETRVLLAHALEKAGFEFDRSQIMAKQ